MPQDIEQAFQAAGLSLFPEKLKDLATDCSCPDWSNPCKHIAAVYYLLGEEFDRDPFLIFKLRGMTRDELVELLGASGEATAAEQRPLESADGPAATGRGRRRRPRPGSLGGPQMSDSGEAVARGGDSSRGREGVVHEAASAPATPRRAEPLPHDAAAFWEGASLPAPFFGEVRAPVLPAALPKRLGSFPFWRAAERFFDALEPIYREASSVGVDVFLGQAAAHEEQPRAGARLAAIGQAADRLR